MLEEQRVWELFLYLALIIDIYLDIVGFDQNEIQLSGKTINYLVQFSRQTDHEFEFMQHNSLVF